MMERGVRWAVFSLVSGVVLYGLFRPTSPEMIFEHSDKVGHVIAFLFLALTGRWALFKYSKLGFWLSMFVLAFLLEFLQGQVRPLRLFSMEDAYANGVGVLLALVVCTIYKYNNKKSLNISESFGSHFDPLKQSLKLIK